MAELADALDLGSSVLDVQVQLLLLAPLINIELKKCLIKFRLFYLYKDLYIHVWVKKYDFYE